MAAHARRVIQCYQELHQTQNGDLCMHCLDYMSLRTPDLVSVLSDVSAHEPNAQLGLQLHAFGDAFKWVPVSWHRCA